MTFKQKMESRKFWLALTITIASILVLCLPAVINVFFGTTIMLISGSEFVSLLVTVYGIYAAGNVYDKKVAGDTTNPQPARKVAKNDKNQDEGPP